MRISKPPQERRAELLAAARRLFDKNGTANTRVSDIVKSVGVSQGVFYYYFKSKQEIEQAVIRQVSAELSQQISAVMAADASFYSKMANLILLYLDVVDQFTGDNEASVSAQDDEIIHQQLMVSGSESLLANAVQQLLLQGVQQGLVKVEYPVQTVQVLALGLRSYARSHLPPRHLVFTLAEQCLQLPKGSLVAFCDDAVPTPVQPAAEA